VNDLPWSLRTTTAPLGIRVRVSDAKQIRDAGGIQALHICPATGNAPTRMTRASWDRLCAATQERSRERECIDKNQAQLMRMTRRLNVCAWCQGKILPRGLEFIDAAEMAAMIKPQEEAMAKQSKVGICENCGDKGALTGSFGRRVCSTCLKIRSNVNSHLEKVATAARDMGKGQELLAALVPDGGGLAIKVTADLLQEISGIVGYDGEDPAELVEAVRKSTALAAHQLISEAETGALRTISGIVGYEGTDGEQLVEVVRKRVLTCASCEAEDVLAEIRGIVGYAPNQGDKGLADAVRAFADRRTADVPDCADCDAANALLEIAELVGKRGASSGLVAEAVKELVERAATLSATGDFLRDDLMRACGLEDDGGRRDWGWAVVAAIQTIAELINHWDDLLRQLTRERADNSRMHIEIGRLSGQTHSESEEMTDLRGDFEHALQRIETASAKLRLAEQSRDEWERRAVEAESNVETLEAELRNRDAAPAAPSLGYCCSDSGLLDIALAVLRDEPVKAGDLATLIDAARRAA
jgi:hypothetical protein